LANIIDIIVNGKDNASRVLEKVGQTAERAFQRAERASTQLTSRMKEIGDRGREVGENMVDMSENLMQGLTVPIALLGGVALKSAGDIDRMFSILQAQTGNSEAAMKRLTPIVQQVFRDGLGKDLNEVATIAGHAQRQLWMLNDAQLSGVINNVAALSTILGIDAVGAIDQARELMMKFGITSDQAMDLVAAGVDTADLNSKNLAKTLQQVKGRAEEITGIAADDTWVQFTSVWRQIQEALKPVGDELAALSLKYLPAVVASVKDFSNWFSSLSDKAKVATVGIAAFVAVLPVMLMTLGAITMLGSSLIGFFGTLGGWLSSAGASVVKFASQFRSLSTIGVTGWIGLAVGALILLYNTSTRFANFVNGSFKAVWESLKQSFSTFVASLEPIKNSLSGLGAAFTGIWETISPLVEFLGVILVGALVVAGAALSGLVAALGPVINALVNAVTAVIRFVEAILKLATGDLPGAYAAIQAGTTAFIAVFISLWQGLVNFFTAFWATLVQVAAAFGVNLKSVIVSAFNSTLTFIVGVISGISSTIINGFRIAASFVSGVISGIVGTIRNGFNLAKSAVSSAISAVRSTITAGFNAARSIVSSVISSIRSTIVNGFAVVRSTVSNAASSIRSILSGLASQAYSWGSNLITMFGNGIKNKIGAVVEAARKAAEKIKSYLGFSSPTELGPGANADKWAPNLMSMFAQGMESGIPKIRMAATNAADATTSIKEPTSPTTSANTSRQQPIINIYEAQRTTDKEVLNAMRKAAFLYG
jgi:phage-related protein